MIIKHGKQYWIPESMLNDWFRTQQTISRIGTVTWREISEAPLVLESLLRTPIGELLYTGKTVIILEKQ